MCTKLLPTKLVMRKFAAPLSGFFFIRSKNAGSKLEMEDVKSAVTLATTALTLASTIFSNSSLVSALDLLTASATFWSMVY